MSELRWMLINLRTTLIATVLGTALIVAASRGNIDLKIDPNIFDGIEKNEIDDVLVGLAMIFIGLTIDRVMSDRRKRRHAEVEAQKLKTLQATMRTVQDIVNNFLNNLLLFQMDTHSQLPPHAFDQIEELSKQTFDRLKALGNVEEIREIVMGIGAGIEYLEPPSVRPHFS